jgi:CBS domain-containing protein
MTVGEICNREVIIIDQDGLIQEAIRLMREHHVGDVVVVEQRGGERYPVGILTDRDIVVEILAEGVDLDAVAIKDVMSYQLLEVRERDDVADALRLMRSKGVRRLPVVNDQGVLAGILSVDDVMDVLAEELMDLATLIRREQLKEQLRRT